MKRKQTTKYTIKYTNRQEMKARLLARMLVSVLLMLTSLTAFSADDGTRGGGTFVGDGKVSLKDFQKGAACDWRTGEDILAQYGQMPEVFQPLEKLDWYFARVFMTEMQTINWCMTGELQRVDDEDRESLFATNFTNQRQAAIRILGEPEVYVNEALVNSTARENQMALYTHETVHSFIALDAPMRNVKVKSAVRTIKQVMSGKIRKRADFIRLLAQSDFVALHTTEALEQHRDLIQYVLGVDSERNAILERTTDVEMLFSGIDSKALWSKDLSEQDAVTVSLMTYAGLIREACEQGDSGIAVQKLLGQPHLSPRTIATCLRASPKSSALAKALIARPEFSTEGTELISELAKKSLSIRDYRVHVSAALSELAQPRPTDLEGHLDTDELGSLLPLAEGGKFSPKAEILYTLISTMLENDQHTALKALLTDDFYEAFNFTKLTADLAAAQVPIARERPLCEKVLQEVPRAFWSTFLTRLSKEVGQEKADFFKAVLNLDQLFNTNR